MKLTDTQIRKLSASQGRLGALQAELAREQALQQDLIEMVLDAHGAPRDAVINPRTWELELPGADEVPGPEAEAEPAA